jgi:ribosomal protein RSM22 (predicted rRNA methylase)
MSAVPTGGGRQLAAALDTLLEGHRQADLDAATTELIAVYRSGKAPLAPAVSSPSLALAYAAYRMPATHAAVAQALQAALARDATLAPHTQLDIGGGTGAAVWAAAETIPTLRHATVLDASQDALRIGERLAQHSPAEWMHDIQWTSADITARWPLLTADLITIAYVLGELQPGDRTALTAAGARSGGLVLVVEPGTPAGYRRVIEAREVLISAGLRILAPCPHHGQCPLAETDDWCHMAARLNRSPRHRRAKNASLCHEDEKYSYVAAAASRPAAPADRIIRRPRTRKGLVELTLCVRDGGTRTETITRRDGALYRHARNAEWNGTWPPTEQIQGAIRT